MRQQLGRDGTAVGAQRTVVDETPAEELHGAVHVAHRHAEQPAHERVPAARERAAPPRVGARRAPAHHGVGVAERRTTSAQDRGIELPVPVGEEDPLAARGGDAGAHGRAVAAVRRVADDADVRPAWPPAGRRAPRYRRGCRRRRGRGPRSRPPPAAPRAGPPRPRRRTPPRRAPARTRCSSAAAPAWHAARRRSGRPPRAAILPASSERATVRRSKRSGWERRARPGPSSGSSSRVTRDRPPVDAFEHLDAPAALVLDQPDPAPVGADRARQDALADVRPGPAPLRTGPAPPRRRSPG